MTDKSENAYKTIGEVAEILRLNSKKRSFLNPYYSILGKTIQTS